MTASGQHKYVRRRNARPEWVQLPQGGYTGKVPDWPLVNEASDAELSYWEALWRTPQATVWAESGAGVARVVARYVMTAVLSEVEPTASMLAQVSKMEQNLGLTPKAMKDLQWEVDASSPDKPKLAEVTPIDRYANL